jgi:alkylation response protein AidB-like acyl-CoA dehydrogenase
MQLLRSTAQKMLATDPSLHTVADAGFLALLTSESLGGAGWRPIEACVVAEEAGRALASQPWSANLIAAAALSADERWHETAIDLMEGRVTAAVARRDRLVVHDRTDRVSGRVPLFGDTRPDVLILLSRSAEPLAIDCAGEGISLESSLSVDTTRQTATTDLRDAAAHRVIGVEAALLFDAAIAVTCADSLGALARSVTLLTDHLVNRSAFERPLAGFQVVQHRLANLTVLEAACAAMLRRLTALLTTPNVERTELVMATHSYFLRNVPASIDDCIQLAGGIGFTWDFPLHHAMRRTVANSHAIRGRHGNDEAVKPTHSKKEAVTDVFRSRARRVIADHRPFEMREGHRAPADGQQEAALRKWYRTLYDNQLLGSSWPEEWGGDPAHKPEHELIVTEELIRARAPRPIDQVQLASHVILQFGTDAQKERYLPRIRGGQDIWCQLFSEPECGSDLAGLRAKAELRADGCWALSGQKTWTTDGHWAQMGLALLRTATGTRRHEGISAFLVPMDAAALEVQPKQTVGGAYEFNDVFLDGVVLQPEQLLGEVGQGWAVAMSGLEIERFGVGGNVLLLELLLRDLVDIAQSVRIGDAPAAARLDISQDISDLSSDAWAARAFVDDHVERTLQGHGAAADASIAKLLYTETYNAIARYGSMLVDDHSPVPQDVGPQAQRLIDAWLWSRALTISGGSSEIMRNIIAKRRLGLPQ